VGSVLCGSRDLVKDAMRWRKMLGGGMRQSGILAAAGLYALEHNVDRLADDHRNAATLAEGLSNIDGLRIEPVQTNIVYVHVAFKDCVALQAHLAEQGVCALIGPKTRLVTHLDVSEQQITTVLQAFRDFFA
jgi:threonine aldolase